MRQNYDGKQTRWLDAFLEALRSEAGKAGPRLARGEADLFGGPVAVAVLQEVLADGWAPGLFGGVYASPPLIAGNLFAPTKTVRRLLRAFARAGLLMAVNAWDPTKTRQAPLEIILNPDFADACRLGAPKKVREQLASVFAELFVARRTSERDVQGFGDRDVPWGRLEADRAPVARSDAPSAPPAPAKPAGTLLEKIREAKEGKRPDAKARREADRVKRSELKEAFVQGAATVWTIWRGRHGFGTEAPSWAGPPGTLPLAQRRERVELERLFEQLGGQRGATAWLAFCSGGVDRDAKGKAIFEPRLAHRQYATPDKKPSHFAKHVSLVFDEMRQLGFGKNQETQAKLRLAFGESFDAPPRHAPTAMALPERDPTAKGPDDGNPAPATP